MRDSTIAKLGKLMVTGGSVLITPRRAAKRLARVSSPAAARALAEAVVKVYDREVVDIACRALARLVDQAAIDEVCQVWCRQPVAELDRMVAGLGWVASRPAYARARSALRVGRLEVLADGDQWIATSLVEIADGDDCDALLRERAREALAMLREDDAREAACTAAIDRGSESVLRVAAEAGFLPEDPGRRAVLLFLTGRHDEYAELDFDGGLLRAAHAAAEAPLRRSLAAAARQSGKLDWVRAVTAGTTAELSDEEWQTARMLMVGARRWADLWRLAVDAPPVWAADLLRALGASGWRPDGEREEFDALVRYAQNCADHPVVQVLNTSATDSREWVHGLTTTPDGGLLIAGNNAGLITLWRLPTGEPAGQINAAPGTVTALAVSPDGNVLVSSGSHHLRTWQLPSGRLIADAGVYRHLLAISPDGRSLICIGPLGGDLEVWRLPALSRTGTLTEPYESIRDLVTGADGTLVAGSSRWSSVYVRRWPSLEKVAVIRGGESSVFSPDASLLATGKDNDVRLWHLPSGAPAAVLTGHTGPVTRLAVAPDGSLLASASRDDTVRLWRLPSGEPAGTLGGARPRTHPPAQVTHLSVTLDSRLLICASEDYGLQLWHLPSGQPASTLDGPVTALALTPDGGQLASGSGGVVRLWLPRISTLAGTPSSRISLTDVAWLRAGPGQSVAERPWIELISGLVQRRHRYDIAIGHTPAAPAGATDIEIDQ